MQPQHSKTHTVLLLVLVLMAGVIIGLLLADSRQKVEAPVVTPVQTSVQTPAPEVKTEAQSIKNYSNNYFSFNYSGNASVQFDSGNGDGAWYEVNVAGGDFPDFLQLFNTPIPDEYNSCNNENVKEFGIKVEKIVINGKTFTTCNTNEGRFYIYTKNNKSVTIMSTKPQVQYIDLGSLEIK